MPLSEKQNMHQCNPGAPRGYSSNPELCTGFHTCVCIIYIPEVTLALCNTSSQGGQLKTCHRNLTCIHLKEAITELFDVFLTILRHILHFYVCFNDSSNI